LPVPHLPTLKPNLLQSTTKSQSTKPTCLIPTKELKTFLPLDKTDGTNAKKKLVITKIPELPEMLKEAPFHKPLD